MLKRYVAIFTVVIFIITMLPLTFVQKVHAYANDSYFNDLKVGLVSMSSTNITVTLNGDYTLNGQVYPSGAILNFGISGTNIIFNGANQSQINLVPNSSGNLLTITSGAVSNKYAGSFIIKVYNGKLMPINNIDMESYLKGVVGYEMSDSFPIEALKAQAVAARNYALSRIGYETAKGYDFDDTINYQVYKGYNASYTKVISAVEQTKGQVLLYNDKLVETLYSAWHGGSSEDSENVWGNSVPYLRAAQDTYESDPWPNGNRVLTNADIQAKLVTKGYLTSTDVFVKLDLSSITNFVSGRVSNINIIYKDSTGLVKTKSVTKDSTRTFLSLPSNLYTVIYDSVNGTYTFSGKGNGHGLGMSQIGAKNRGIAGQTFEQILKFYYQNSYLQNLKVYTASINNFTVSKTEVLVGQQVAANADVQGGSGSYMYKYEIIKDGNTVTTRDFAADKQLSFTPDQAGTYTINAYIKDALSLKDYDDMKLSTIKVYDKPDITFTGSGSSGLVQNTFNYSISETNGSGKAQYKFVVTKNSSIVTDSGYTDSNTFSFTPTAAGSYQVNGYVKDMLSENPFDAQSTLSLDIYNPEILTVTAVSYFYDGKSIAFTASSTGTSPLGLSYKYEISNAEKIIASNDFNNSNTFNLTQIAAGSYTVKVYGKDAMSSKPYDTMKQFNITINEKPVIITTLPLKYGMTNKDVTSLQTALVKLGYVISDKSGYFGTSTKDAVMAFQKSKGLTRDGVVGSMTCGALNDTLIEKSGIKSLNY